MIPHAVASVCGLAAVLTLVGWVAAEPVPVAPPPHAAPVVMLGPGRAFAARGRVDLFVAATKAWELPAADDRLWQPALDLAWALVTKGQFRWWPMPGSNHTYFTSMAEFRKQLHPRFIRTDKRYQQEEMIPTPEPRGYYPGGIMAPGVSSPGALMYNIVVSRGEVRTVNPLDNCIVFANGDITVGDFLNDSIVVCDGDVTVEQWTDASLVVARGSIRVKGSINAVTLVAGGTIKPDGKKPARPVVPPNGPDSLPRGGANLFDPVVREKEPKAFGFVTFFELSQVGVEVKAADGAVQITAVSAGKPCAVAGVRAGDTVAAVNGKKPDSVESFRRLLRDALAVGDATVTLRRGERTETIALTLPD